MRNVIEFIGPRGTGKSTLYQSVVKSLPSTSACAGINEFFPYVDMSKKGISGKVEYHIRKKFNRQLKDQRAFQVSGYHFMAQNKALCDFAWNMIDKYQQSDENDTDNRFRTAYNLYNNFLKHQITVESHVNKYCLTGEGIIHASLLIFNKNYDVRDVKKFIGLLPLPHSVLYCETSPELIAQRCQSRRLVVSQMYKSQEQLLQDAKNEIELYRIILDILSQKGVPVFRIDTTRPIAENTRLIINHLNNLDIKPEKETLELLQDEIPQLAKA